MRFLTLFLLCLVWSSAKNLIASEVRVDSPPDSRPSIPENLRYVLYSATVAELFWGASVDDGHVVGYRIIRDGLELDLRDARSYFEPVLQNNKMYEYQIIAVDNAGFESLPATLTLDTRIQDTGTINQHENDAEAPSVPANLRGTIYSSSAAEIFWDAAFDNTGVIEYEIYRNGVWVDTRDARSYFDRDMQTGSIYRYEVIAVDANQNKGNAASVTLSDGIVGNASGLVTLTVSPVRHQLREGDENELVLTVEVRRPTDSELSVDLRLRVDAAEDLDNLDFRFDQSTLSAAVSTTQLRVKLNVGSAPIKFHERRFVLVAQLGATVKETRITFDVIPVTAPDVYLLIGQSNMEGSSEFWAKNSEAGGPDEREVRIKQLNVRQNSHEIFSQRWQYSDESSNVSTPLIITAEDPLHEPRQPGQHSKGGTFVGLGLSFAKAALVHTTQEIVLVPAAWSATGFCASEFGDLGWNASVTNNPALGGTLLVDRALTRLNMTLRTTGGVFRGILWHQGEADSNDAACAYSYKNNLLQLVNRLRSEALVDKRGIAARGVTATIPLVVGTLSRGVDERADFSFFGELKDVIDSAHRSISDYIPHSGFVNNDDLIPPAYPCGAGSCIHFGAAAYREMGQRYYRALRGVVRGR